MSVDAVNYSLQEAVKIELLKWKIKQLIGDENMGEWFLILFWTGPIGVGDFYFAQHLYRRQLMV